MKPKYILVTSLVLATMMISHCHSNHDDNSHHDNHEHDDKHKCTNKYNEECNKAEDNPEDDEMFKKGHMKPFGSHRDPDAMVEELTYSISPQDFYMNYVVKHKPVVLKGAVKHWPAYTKWTDEYLNKTYGNVSFLMETKDDDKINLPPAMKLSEFLDTYRKVNRYLVDEVLPDMRKDVVLPLELRCEEMSQYFFVSYFWMSNGGTSSKIHIDTDENLLCVIHGHKSVILISPEYSRDLYCDESFQLGVSDINPKSVDMKKHPRVKNVRYTLANVEEGDIVYIPQMWWHQVVSRKERQQAVALWWKSKPFWLEESKKSYSKPSVQESQQDKHSYAKALADYEVWTQNVSSIVPRVRCKSQDSFMSDYRWETDKAPDAPVTYGDGGTDEEEKVLKEGYDPDAPARHRYKSPSCNFDKSNLKSPCHYKKCMVEDDCPACVRYILDYCAAYQDRGCVIQLPHIMNKKYQDEYVKIRTMKGDFS